MGTVYTIQDDPSSVSQAQTIPCNHHGLTGTVSHGRIMDARAPSTSTVHAFSCSWRSDITHSTGASFWRRSRELDVPLLKPTCVENFDSIIQKAGIFRASELMAFLRPSSVSLYETRGQQVFGIGRNHCLDAHSAQFCFCFFAMCNDNTAVSAVFPHWISMVLRLRNWKYDPATGLNVKMLLRGIWLGRQVHCKSRPHWNLHWVLLARCAADSGFSKRQSIQQDARLKWWMLETVFLLLLATAHRSSFLHALCVAPDHIKFGTWTGLGSIPFFQFNSNSNSFTFNSNSNSFGMKNSNSNSFLSIPIPIPIPF